MKRFLLTVVLVVELVIGAVLYISFSEVLSTGEIREPAKIQEQPPPTEEPRRGVQQVQSNNQQPVAQSDQPIASIPLQDSLPNNTVLPATQPTPQTSGQSSQQPLVLSSAILRYFKSLPLSAEPNQAQLTDELTSLGRMLYYDPRLSINGTMSCNTCHLLDQYGVDQLVLSLGHNGEPVKRNSPTVYNAALHVDQFWDGRSPTVEEQAKEPILSEAEMGFISPEAVVHTLLSIPGYSVHFQRAFPEDPSPISFDNVGTAIGAFERQLITRSRFDHFIDGDWTQLAPEEFRGLGTFVEVGCTDCHQGVTIGGQLYKKLGEVEPYPTEDLGRYEVTRAASDRFVFKVPSLRNIAETGPYLHDGSIGTLPEMVRLMARYQLGKSLEEQQVSDIVSFLKSLTGELPVAYIAEPALP